MESHELEECEPLLELFWLENPPENTLKLIIQTLFGWDDCLACDRSGTCPLWNCTWNRRQLLDQYLEFYRVVSSWSMPEGLNQGNPALRNHDDLTDIIYLIQQRPDLPRKELIQIHFSSYRSALPDPLDQNRAFDLAMRVLTMIECSPRRCSRVNWSPGFAPIPWYADDSARQFIGRAFQRHAALDVEDEFDRSTFGKLAATSLERRKKIKLVGTYDLQKHLLLEPESRTLYIYHHVGFLKEYLAATRQPTSNIPEILPRQLALETIHSLENILLPLHDTGRHALVERMNLDSGCVQLVELEETQYRRDVEFHIKYHYWGARLKKLEGEVERPGRIRACFRAASSNRFLMLITAIGVLFAAGELIKEFMRK